MGTRHNFYLLDNSIPIDLKKALPFGSAVTSVERGLRPDADDMDVIDVAFDRRALLITADQRFVDKCKKYQNLRHRCMFGLLVLPQGIEIQRQLLDDLHNGRKRLRHTEYDRGITWNDIRIDNLAVVVHLKGHPDVTDLCDCPWD